MKKINKYVKKISTFIILFSQTTESKKKIILFSAGPVYLWKVSVKSIMIILIHLDILVYTKNLFFKNYA